MPPRNLRSKYVVRNGITIYYRKSLEMSSEQLAAVCTRIGKELGIQNVDSRNPNNTDIVVIIRLSDKEYSEKRLDIISNHGVDLYYEHDECGDMVIGYHCAIGLWEGDIPKYNKVEL